MTGTVLIAGASGLVGSAAALEFLHAGWQVIALSRRVPELLADTRVKHLALDLTDAAACRAATATLTNVTHVVYTAVFELPGLIAGWSDPLQIETNGRMLRNLLAPLCAVAKLQHVSLLQGTKAYGAPFRRMRVPARESQPRVEHPNFYWVQEDYLAEMAQTHGLHYTIFRPQLIVGPNHVSGHESAAGDRHLRRDTSRAGSAVLVSRRGGMGVGSGRRAPGGGGAALGGAVVQRLG